jgi:hexosaminidase
VVMAVQEFLYFDRAYAPDAAEPRAYPAVTSVEKVYRYDPVPEAIPPQQRHHVIGAQCELWTEFVPTAEHAEYMYFPRLPAFAEAVWLTHTPEQPESYEEFVPRLTRHLKRLAALGVNYRPLDGPTPGQARIWTRQRAATS